MVGKINGFFGVQGWVKVFSHTEPRKNILTYQPWHIKVDNRWQTLAIIQGREQAKTIIAQIKDVHDREQARTYLGTEIYIQAKQLPSLKEGKYYWEELIGLEVINQNNINLGKVAQLVDTGANMVLVVDGEKDGHKKEHWVPYIAPFLTKVDIEDGQILVDWDEDF